MTNIIHIKVFEIAALLVGAELVVRIMNNEPITKEDKQKVKERLLLLEKLAELENL